MVAQSDLTAPPEGVLAIATVVVGISTFNRADILPKAIVSALAQSHAPLRVSVVDDASTDTTPSIRAEFAGVTWLRQDQNQGYLRARNHIMLTAPEDYYVSLDDDAWFLEGDEIALAANYLLDNPDVAAIAFDILSPDKPGKEPRGEEFSSAMFIGCGHMLRLSVVKELGGYQPFPGSYGAEEKDFCLRMMDAGYQIVTLRGVHVWHDKTLTARDLLRQHRSGVCNDMILTIWRFPASILVQTLSWKFFSHIRFALGHDLLRPCLEGLRDFFRNVGAAWRLRRPVRPASIARFQALTRQPRSRG